MQLTVRQEEAGDLSKGNPNPGEPPLGESVTDSYREPAVQRLGDLRFTTACQFVAGMARVIVGSLKKPDNTLTRWKKMLRPSRAKRQYSTTGAEILPWFGSSHL